MLIPIADVPRWYAERRPEDTIAISHGQETLTWRQLERNANRRGHGRNERLFDKGHARSDAPDSRKPID